MDSSRHGGSTDWLSATGLPQVAMLFDGGISMGLQLGQELLFYSGAFLGRPTGDRFGLDMASFSSLFDIAPKRGLGNLKGCDNLCARFALINRTQHAVP